MRITTAIALAALLLSCPKPPPDAPAKPWGPSEGRPLLKYTFYTTAASHGGESLAYRFSWGDTTTREWTRFYAPGEIVSASHRWLVPGTYGVAVRAQTADGSGSEWSSTTTVFINDGVNQRPRTPTQPIGPDTSWQREESPFYCLAPTDPDGDSVFLRFDWGDGDTGGWRGPLPAGDTAWDEHGWDGSGVQSVRCQAKDTRGAVSAWSAAHTFFSRPLIRPKWELFFGSHHGNTCPAIAGDGTIYVCGGDIIFAVNSDGTIRWQQALPAHGYPLGSVVLGPNGALHLAHGPAVAAFHPDGTSKWTYVGSADPVRTPAVGADGTVYFACRDSTVCALDSTGTLKWRTHVFSNRFAD
ncbi:PQQ-like beta-propeller repeat protein, partial [candidate division WOR-3 bacterium]|nr:PQQ-like beta-propeller repeat protein [candidate division WOR-3 bacterium]